MRHAVAVLIVALAFAALPFVAAQPAADAGGKSKAIELPLGERNWDTHVMDVEPVKLVKTEASEVTTESFDPLTKEKSSTNTKYVKFLVEFTRNLTVRDTDWGGLTPQPPFQFEFRDADGVALQVLPATFQGTLVGRRGRRIWVVLKLSDELVLRRTKEIVVDTRPYGS